MLYPLTFQPLFKERIWGGRHLQTLYGKDIPPGNIGESWEISDRPGDESVVTNGPLAGRSLHWLLEQHGVELMGPRENFPARFPLLIKILDAQEKLSLQVHPPPAKAAELGGEPKTEMWYVAQAGPKADLFVGLKKGVTRAEFEEKLKQQTVAECFHRIPVKAGDAMFLPSGRVHALGAENVIFEIQQNSDTTYRVFDWNRVDQNGKARELHIEQSLASIDFNDIEPGLLSQEILSTHRGSLRPLINNNLFEVNFRTLGEGDANAPDHTRMEIIGIIEGSLRIEFDNQKLDLDAGKFCLLPAHRPATVLRANSPVSYLQIFAG